MDKIVVVNGFPRSGKDSFVDFCLEILGSYGQKVSTVDFVKYIAKECGWNGEKTPENRAFLSYLKALLTAWNDAPFNFTAHNIECFFSGLQIFDLREEGISFVMCREPEEIQKFVTRLGAKTLFVLNKKAESQNFSNKSDKEVLNYQYDYYIDNNGTLEDLKNAAKRFLEIIKEK